MKIQGPSADLLIKVGLGVVVLGLAYWGGKKLFNIGGKVLDSATEIASTSLNPASSENLINRGVNAVGGAIAGEDNWSLGGWIYDITHADEIAAANAPTPYIRRDRSATTGGAHGAY